MKKTLLAFAILLPPLSTARAQQARDIGVGFLAGDTIGASGKYWFDHLSAVDLGLGADSSHSNFTVFGDYLYHGWKALPQPRQGKLAAYVGGGPRLEARGDATEFGVRLITGASYWLPKNPVELFADLGPLFRLTPNGGVYLVGGAGFRYYFKAWN